MQFRIESSLLESFPTIAVYALKATGVKNAIRAISLSDQWAQTEQNLQGLYPNVETLAASPLITEWREIYRQQGVKPSQFRSSIEALARRVVASKPVTTGIPLVDFYNLHSLRGQACLGGYDAATLPQGELVLRHCVADQDTFSPLGGESSQFPLNPKLAVYAMQSEILCWGFNCRDSAKTALNDNTDTAIFFAEAITEGQKQRAISALTAISDSLAQAGATATGLLRANKDQPEITLAS